MNYDSFMKNKVVVPFEAMPKLRVEMEHVKHELVTYLQGWHNEIAQRMQEHVTNELNEAIGRMLDPGNPYVREVVENQIAETLKSTIYEQLYGDRFRSLVKAKANEAIEEYFGAEGEQRDG